MIIDEKKKEQLIEAVAVELDPAAFSRPLVSFYRMAREESKRRAKKMVEIILRELP